MDFQTIMSILNPVQGLGIAAIKGLSSNMGVKPTPNGNPMMTDYPNGWGGTTRVDTYSPEARAAQAQDGFQKPQLKFPAGAYSPGQHKSDAREMYYNGTPAGAPEVPTQNEDDQLGNLIAQLIQGFGSNGGVDMNSVKSDVNKAYDPAFASIDKLRGMNKSQNASDIKDVLGIYKMLSGDYKNTAKGTGQRYNKQADTSRGQYDQSSADVNGRFDQQIADMTAQLTKLGQTQLIDSETAKINKQRDGILNNLTQGKQMTGSSYSRQSQSMQDFFNAGAVGAGLQGADKAAELKMALQKALMGLDQNQMTLEQARAGDITKSYNSSVSAKNTTLQDQVDALLKLKGSNRDDALAAYKMQQDNSQQPKTIDNVYGRASSFINNSVSDPNMAAEANRIFQDFTASNDELINGQYIDATGRGQSINATRARQLATQYAQNNGLTPQQAQLLILTVQNSYK